MAKLGDAVAVLVEPDPRLADEDLLRQRVDAVLVGRRVRAGAGHGLVVELGVAVGADELLLGDAEDLNGLPHLEVLGDADHARVIDAGRAAADEEALGRHRVEVPLVAEALLGEHDAVDDVVGVLLRLLLHLARVHARLLLHCHRGLVDGRRHGRRHLGDLLRLVGLQQPELVGRDEVLEGVRGDLSLLEGHLHDADLGLERVGRALDQRAVAAELVEHLIDEECLLLAGLLVGLELARELGDGVGLGEHAGERRDHALDRVTHAGDDDLRAAVLGLHCGVALIVLVGEAALRRHVGLDVLARVLDGAGHDHLGAILLERLEVFLLAEHQATPPAARDRGFDQSDCVIMWFSLIPITPIRMASAPWLYSSWRGCGLMVLSFMSNSVR